LILCAVPARFTQGKEKQKHFFFKENKQIIILFSAIHLWALGFFKKKNHKNQILVYKIRMFYFTHSYFFLFFTATHKHNPWAPGFSLLFSLSPWAVWQVSFPFCDKWIAKGFKY
jgi:hypothetical protein